MALTRVIALDLEGTLISNAMSQIPRPGLRAFLDDCASMGMRIVIFTTLREQKFREVANQLVKDGFAPAWYATAEYVSWTGKTKDLSLIPGVRPDEVLLVDDNPDYVHSGQESQWVEVQCFETPYPDDDAELLRVMGALRVRLQ